jgi:hypothetical protein
MWPKRVCATVVLFSAAQGCTAVTDPGIPEVENSLLNVVQDCRLATLSCDQINKAITFLQNSNQPQCRELGEAARARFNAIGFGFRYGDGAMNDLVKDFDMYTSWNPNPLTGAVTDGNTYVNASGLLLSRESMAGLLAHEEMHHQGRDGGQHESIYATQRACTLG